MDKQYKKVKAKKDYVCDWCGFIIKAGEIYETQTLKDDEIYRWKNHIACSETANKLKMFDECNEGLTSEDFHIYITEEYEDIWSKINNNLYKSNDFKLPSFKEQLDYICDIYGIGGSEDENKECIYAEEMKQEQCLSSGSCYDCIHYR